MVFLGKQGVMLLRCTSVGIIVNFFTIVSSSVFYNVTCASNTMSVLLNLNDLKPKPLVYLQNLKGYPGCDPEIHKSFLLFRLDLNDTVHCGVTKMLNKQTGHTVFYHRLVIEVPKRDLEILLVQCVIPGDFNMDFVRLDWQRESIPVHNYSLFEEPPSRSWNGLSSQQSVPYLHMSVRDKGTRLDTNTVVHPGSLLDLLIYLEKDAADLFGISLRYLTLTDEKRNQEEIVVMNGCSVDPFVIQVFREDNGVLRSQFRAFKLQSSEFVIFIATVNVCMHRCIEVECYGQADTNGRRKREIPRYLPHYRNEVYDVEITTFLRMKMDVEGDIIREDSTNETLDSFYENGEDYSYVEPSCASRISAFSVMSTVIIIIGTSFCPECSEIICS